MISRNNIECGLLSFILLGGCESSTSGYGYDYSELSGITESAGLSIWHVDGNWEIRNQVQSKIIHYGGGNIFFTDHYVSDLDKDGKLDLLLLYRVHYGQAVFYASILYQFESKFELINLRIGRGGFNEHLMFGGELNSWTLPEIEKRPAR